jgi:imidazolonepropionase-like amidohydrolase
VEALRVHAPARLAIRCGRLYAGDTAPAQTNVTVIIDGGRIERIVANDEPLDDDRKTLEAVAAAPGLINAHVHLEFSGEPDIGVLLLSSPISKTLVAAANARRSLEAGVTTVRDLGGSDSNAIELRDAIATGAHTGPTIVPAGRVLCMTGGHGHFIGRETDGPWDVRKAVREQRKAGAACIKLIATGGVLTKGAVPGQDQLTEEEMHAAILEARTHDMRVAAHAIGTSGIKNALRAGVDSIEHGHLLDDEAIELFRARNAYLVPTLAAVVCIYEHISDGKQPDFVVRKATELYAAARENITRAYRAGVTIAGGSDAGTPYNFHEKYAYEIELMHTMLGMSPREALHAGTQTAGELLGVEAGLIAVGRPADLLLLDDDLETNTFALRTPRVVVKAGAIVAARDSG